MGAHELEHFSSGDAVGSRLDTWDARRSLPDVTGIFASGRNLTNGIYEMVEGGASDFGAADSLMPGAAKRSGV